MGHKNRELRGPARLGRLQLSECIGAFGWGWGEGEGTTFILLLLTRICRNLEEEHRNWFV
jgi:hypothetical protein